MKALVKKELFNGRYLPFEPLAELPDGSIVSGLNMLRASLFGGWTPRYGSILVNTTAVGTSVLSLHQYRNPFYGDYHLFAQIGNGLYSLSQAAEPLLTEGGEELTTEDGETLLATTAADPLSQRSTMGSSQYTTGENPGFSCMVGEDFIYADGTVSPLIYGGEKPRCDGFMVYDGTNGTYIDCTNEVTDDDLDTYATITAHANTVYYVGMKEPGTEIQLGIGTGNTAAVTPTVKAVRSGAWADVTATDGTDGSETHDQTGSLTWAAGSDQMRVIGGRQLYWYEVSFSDAPTATTITSCNVARAMQPITIKWDGEWREPIGALFYDASASEYIDKLGAVTDESQSTYMDISSMTTSDYIYIKTQSRVLGFAFVMVEGNINTANAQVDLIEHMAADGSWTTCGTFEDSTLDSGGTDGFGENGFLWIDNTYDPVETTFAGDDVPGYWHRLSVDASLSVTTHVAEIAYATWPDDIPNFTGCVEYLSTLTLWGCPRYPNRLIQSASNRPDFLCRADLRMSPPFGAYDPILNAVTVGNYIVVYKRNSIYLWDGESDIPTVVSTDVGLASVHSVALISGGDKTMKDDEIRVILMHQARDGVYKLSISSSGYLMTKTSEAIRNYFNPLEDEYIGAASINNLSACYEKITDTYRLFLPDSVLAYSVGTNEWLPVWEYPLNQTCGLSCIGPDNEQIMLAGTDGGFVLQLDTVNSDRNSSNTATAIEHKIKTRPLFVSVDNIPAVTGLLRKTWVEALVDSGTYTYNLYVNRESSGAAVTKPSSPTLVKSGKEVTVQRFDHSEENIHCFQAELVSNTVGQKLEPYSISYQIKQIRTLE